MKFINKSQKYRFSKNLDDDFFAMSDQKATARTPVTNHINNEQMFSPAARMEKNYQLNESDLGMRKRQSYADDFTKNRYIGDLRSTYGQMLKQDAGKKGGKLIGPRSEAWEENIKFQDDC